MSTKIFYDKNLQVMAISVSELESGKMVERTQYSAANPSGVLDFDCVETENTLQKDEDGNYKASLSQVNGQIIVSDDVTDQQHTGVAPEVIILEVEEETNVRTEVSPSKIVWEKQTDEQTVDLQPADVPNNQ